MTAHEEEKKFLRKVRHRAFHPDYDSPILFRLVGYLVRLVVLLVIIAAILFVRNRHYFNGESFATTVQTELDRYLHAEESDLEDVYWKDDKAVTIYRAKGGPQAYFNQITLPRIAARGQWRDLLTQHGWTLQDVEIANAFVYLKGGPTPSVAETAPSETPRSDSWLVATPDFSRTHFGDIKLFNATFHWGPRWTSKGSLEGASGILKRQDDQWSLTFTEGELRQNWLKNLQVQPEHPLNVSVTEEQINLNGGPFAFGETGEATLDGSVTLSDAPEYDLEMSMKTIQFTDLLPDEFHTKLDGLADLEMTLTGSTNRSDGIIFEGEITVVESGRLRQIPILNSLSMITPRLEMRQMPIRTGSTLKFKSRQGVLTVYDIDIKGGGVATSQGYTTAEGDLLDFARIKGAFTYKMDTSALDGELSLEYTRPPAVEKKASKDPEAEFEGEVQVGMPWELLGQDEAYREKYFTPDDEGYGWITVSLNGPLESISDKEAAELDTAWSEVTKSLRNPF